MPRPRHTKADYHTLAIKRGFVWLGPKLPANVRIITNWLCNADIPHIFSTRYQNVNQGGGCRYCYYQSMYGNNRHQQRDKYGRYKSKPGRKAKTFRASAQDWLEIQQSLGTKILTEK